MISAFVNFRKKNDKVHLFPGAFAMPFTYIIQNIHLCQALSFFISCFRYAYHKLCFCNRVKGKFNFCKICLTLTQQQII